jgi:hypothetical protein
MWKAPGVQAVFVARRDSFQGIMLIHGIASFGKDGVQIKRQRAFRARHARCSGSLLLAL